MNETFPARANKFAATKRLVAGKSSAFPKDIKYLDEMRHPGVCRLEKEVIDLLKCGTQLSITRNQIMIRSLAIPFSLLRDSGNHTPRGRELLLKEFRSTVIFLLSLDGSKDQDLDYIKYQVSNQFQVAVKDIRQDTGHSLPPPSEAIAKVVASRKTLFQGYSNRLLKRHVFRGQNGNAKSLSILASFMLSKRGWPGLSQYKLGESVKDHQHYLTLKLAPISTDLDDSIKFVIQESIGKSAPNVFSKFSPSHNASYATSRKNGGAFSEVIEEPYRPPSNRPAPTLGARNLPPRGSWIRPSLLSVNRSIGKWKKKARKRVVARWDESLRSEPDNTKSERPATLSFTSQADLDSKQINIVRVQEVADSGKFRLITAGGAVLYSTLQGLQGELLSKWAEHSASTMIDGWEEEICGWVAPPGWLWNSGDYKAATDQLNGSACESAQRHCLRVFGLDNLYTGLLDAEIQYPKKLQFEGVLPSVTQTNGQLMGHPLSFPLLCYINYAGLICAIGTCIRDGRLSTEEGKFIRNHTKVNGDDILFCCPPWFSPIWENVAKQLGLVLSIGKSYASEHFAMVNNVMFIMNKEGGRRIGYLNQKLVLNKDPGGEQKDSPLEIGQAYNKMFSLFPLSRDFLSDCVVNRNLVSTFGYQPNFFVNCKLGGLGVLKEYAKGPIRLTSTQRRISAAFAENVVNSFMFATGVSTSGPLAKYLTVIPEPRLSTAANNELWNDRYRSVGEVQLMSSDASSYQSWVAVFTSMTSKIEEKTSRRINLRSISKVNPMKRSKCLTLEPVWLFPELPKPSTGFSFSYPTRLEGGAIHAHPDHPTRNNNYWVIGNQEEIRQLISEL